MQRLENSFLGRSLVGIVLCIALLGFLWSCTGDETTTTTTEGSVTNPNPNPFQPRGNIQGVVRDAVSGKPIEGAVVSIEVPGASQVTVTTLADGQYSFTDLPASVWSDAPTIDADGDGTPDLPDGQVQFGELSTYTITVDLSGVNEALPEGAAPFPTFATGPAAVGFSSFLEGNAPACPAQPVPGGGDCVEGGSGANTPIDGLTTTLNFDIGPKTETIRGTVRNALTGEVIVGARVSLLDGALLVPTPAPAAVVPPPNAIRLSLDNTTTETITGEDGSFVFTEVPASHLYNVEVVAAGFVPNGTLRAGTGPFPTLGGGVEVLVPATPATGVPGGQTGAGGLPTVGEIFMAPPEVGVDVVAPFPTEADPADGADIDVTAETGDPRRPIVITFNERMQTDNAFTQPVVATTDFKGLPTAPPGTSDAQVAVTSEWNEDGTVLTITPVNDWQPGVTYGVAIGVNGLGFGNIPLADLQGNTCCLSTPANVLGDETAGVGEVFGEVAPSPGVLLFTTNGGAGALAGPAARLAENSADFNGTSATVEWDAVEGARAYKVYMSISGGEFQLIAQTAPGNDPVTTLPATAWNMNAALAAGPGVNPGVALGYDGVARNVLETTITDVGDDVSPTVPIDTANGLADLSDGFANVRIAVSVLNSNDVEGSLGSPVVIADNTGPTTNGGAAQVGAGATPIQTLNMTVGPPAAGALATLSRGQVLLDINQDGEPDAILLGFSEPLAEVTAETVGNYELRAADGSAPARLTEIRITAAMLNEEVSAADGIFVSADDVDGDGFQDTGQDVDENGTKGNSFGNTFVTLLIEPGPSGVIDIRDGDFVALSLTSVQDLNGNANQQTDPTEVTNQLIDSQEPLIVSATVNAAAQTVTINFSEGVNIAPVPGAIVTIAGVNCTVAGAVSNDVDGDGNPDFQNGDENLPLLLDPTVNPACDLNRLGEGDNITFTGFTVTDTSVAANPLGTEANALVFIDGAFEPTAAADLANFDTTDPELVSATIENNPGTGTDFILLSFSERLGTFAEANIVVQVGPVPNCNVAFGGTDLVTVDPAFIPGDTAVRLAINVAASPGNVCDLANLASGNFIALGPPNTATAAADTAGNPLSGEADHAVRNDDNTAYVIDDDGTL